ncbi:indolepyruvate ferredoxin oxidoreductase family protein [Jannaschia sp. W003]|uniref:indolepyruvate ferredoxin oxidoreductase family protein n=1 Tax=Jannaschia sp. W003 TaxID=2867012 RepID=UPI0021A3F55E|nr:indolepyruvate ferredoxin oxidoreductase family protein [Jannaschia sp. W003]UWQ20439.1 indolepyruvate ferredoxin oxidoreductase family protein [Jannaschia sp. W003]
MRHDVTLGDRYDLGKDTVLLNGTQALVRLVLMQKERDRRAGLNTAGLVAGYRGSPLGAVDLTMAKSEKLLTENDIQFRPALNEDLGVTMHWGAQQAELRGEGRYDGVFGLWYGKGPGVDRSGDAMRHANMAGTSRHGGVLMAMGDDHTGESSTTCHQSDWALIDVHMPVLSPAGVQEILDFGQYGYALSRYSGLWVGLKTMKDTIEVTSVVDGRPGRMDFVEPADFEIPEGGLNIRLNDHWIPQEERLLEHKRWAAEAFARANRMDKRMHGKPGAKIGLVSHGKNWLDLVHAMHLLGLDDETCERLGITTYKVAQIWPMDMESMHEWAEGLETIVVVEEKRKLIEVQVKEAIFDDRHGRRVLGYHDERGEIMFPQHYALDPTDIAVKLGELLGREGMSTDRMEEGLRRTREARRADNAEEIAGRTAWFCSGCPHNTSTKVPEGARAGAGIGCHVMALWMNRNTEGYTHMGAEGVNWIGESLFSTRRHVFQNLGEGTYNHSGSLAIRAALAAGTNITYKILYNDAVAMTGGQHNEGDLQPQQIAHELKAMGVKEVAVVYDEKEDVDRTLFPSGLTWHERAEMPAVQERMQQVEGVSAILYIQTCAAEKRRRRKRGLFPDPDRRIFIDTDVCEGCGDCGVQSNCVSLVPVDTELGTKRAVDQSTCNKDYSCVQGFCPSFVSVEGAKKKQVALADVDTGGLPEPALPAIDGTWNVVVTGVGGTGVVTIGAVSAMAAYLDGKAAGLMEMAGLAQKGGAVQLHLRLAEKPEHINAIRVATGEADALIGGDLVVSAGRKTLGLTSTGRTGAVVNAHEIVTGDFTGNPDFKLPADRLRLSLEARLRDRLHMFDASRLAEKVLGDSIFSNMAILGAAWQQGVVPLSREAILRAVELNGAAVAKNQEAFELGRWAMVHPERAAKLLAGDAVVEMPKTLEQRIAFRERHLTDYQNAAYARRYTDLVAKAPDGRLREAVALGYHKLLAYKDEYEVARLLQSTRAKVEAAFDGDLKLTHHLAPPVIAKEGPDGRPAKRAFGEWIRRGFPLLARLKVLRGTPVDPFGRTGERRMERALIAQYERDMAEVLPLVSDRTRDAVVALAELPLTIRGFGPVKQANAAKAEKRREVLLATIRAGGPEMAHAAE